MKNKEPRASLSFRTRFGINTGIVIVGNIGTNERMNYTVIGDAVNTTFRLQDIDKYFHTNIIVSESVYKRLGPEFVLRPLDDVAVKGKMEKTKIYELIGLREGDPDLWQNQRILRYSRILLGPTKLFIKGSTVWQKLYFLQSLKNSLTIIAPLFISTDLKTSRPKVIAKGLSPNTEIF